MLDRSNKAAGGSPFCCRLRAGREMSWGSRIGERIHTTQLTHLIWTIRKRTMSHYTLDVFCFPPCDPLRACSHTQELLIDSAQKKKECVAPLIGQTVNLDLKLSQCVLLDPFYCHSILKTYRSLTSCALSSPWLRVIFITSAFPALSCSPALSLSLSALWSSVLRCIQFA